MSASSVSISCALISRESNRSGSLCPSRFTQLISFKSRTLPPPCLNSLGEAKSEFQAPDNNGQVVNFVGEDPGPPRLGRELAHWLALRLAKEARRAARWHSRQTRLPEDGL